MPVGTRAAMLEGIRANRIIVGAYTDGRGGICPMLAAHRGGGRTNLLAFARAWDRFTDAGGRARRASRRELRVLVSHLESSLEAEDQPALGEAIREHAALRDRSARRQAAGRPGDPDRGPELSRHAGWAWLRPVRRYEDYARALEQLQTDADADAALEPEPEHAGA